MYLNHGEPPANTLEINAVGTVNLFEAIKNQQPRSRVQVAGSSEEYGLVYPDEIPIKETNFLRPLSPYGVSKVAEDLLGIQYNKSFGLEIIVTRGFNHSGPRRGKDFVISSFAKQIVDIENGKEPIIYVGSLEAKRDRDFTDVRDMVRGYLFAIEKGRVGEQYNICSGKAYSIREILDLLLSYSKVKVKIEQDSLRMRPSDVPILCGSYEKFNKDTGWKPEIPFKKTLKDLLDYWRNQ